jgi:hypothetical protein
MLFNFNGAIIFHRHYSFLTFSFNFPSFYSFLFSGILFFLNRCTNDFPTSHLKWITTWVKISAVTALESKAPHLASRINKELTLVSVFSFERKVELLVAFRNQFSSHDLTFQVTAEWITTWVKISAVTALESKAPHLASRINKELTLVSIFSFERKVELLVAFRNQFSSHDFTFQVTTEWITTWVKISAETALESKAPHLASRINKELTLVSIFSFERKVELLVTFRNQLCCHDLTIQFTIKHLFSFSDRTFVRFFTSQMATEWITSWVNNFTVTTRKPKAPLLASRINKEVASFGVLRGGSGTKRWDERHP